jgi:hypothetical protein
LRRGRDQDAACRDDRSGDGGARHAGFLSRDRSAVPRTYKVRVIAR